MSKIKKLAAEEIQKIAAGEVIDRPANIAKELLENAIDAGATHIRIMIEDGGKKLIRIVDNGCGMDETDAHICYEHHATSKIDTVQDITAVKTFGFRGEALSSISSVSKMHVTTKDASAEQAFHLELESNNLIREEYVSAKQGTDIAVHDLFFNVPARKKFLKSRDTERRLITQLVRAYALAYCEIHIELFSEDECVLRCPSVDSLHARWAQLWEYTSAERMRIVHNSDAVRDIQIEGLVSDHQYMRYDRSALFIFVNNRWVKNQHLTRAITKGYLNILPPGRYPAGCIMITTDPLQVDINTHPRKEEVKFLHPQVVESLILHAVKAALDEVNSKKNESPQVEKNVISELPNNTLEYVSQPFKQSSYSDFDMVSNIASIMPKVAQVEDAKPLKNEIHIQKAFEQQQQIMTSEKTITHYAIIGQYKKTYIMVEHDDGLLFIDQHAAHERVLYELFAKRFEDVASVKLLFPVTISISESDYALLEPFLPIIKDHGIHVELFGPRELVLTSTPVNLQNHAPQELVLQCVGWIKESGSIEKEQLQQLVTEKLRAQMACKAAVKAGDLLSHDQMQQLLQDLEKTDNAIACPHGRPTRWLLTLSDIEKKFKRDYRSYQSIE